MKIYVEGSSTFKNRWGIGSFTMRLVESYSKRYPQDKITLFGFKFFTRPLPDFPIKPSKNLNYRIIRWLPGRVYNMLFRLNLGLPLDIFLGWSPNVIIFPNFVRWPVLNPKAKTLVFIHDLSFVYFPQFANPINLSDTTRFVPKAIKKANRIMTISESSKRQIINHFKVPAEKISIVYPAVDPSFFYRRSKAEINKVQRKYKLPPRYVLYHGTIEPRKNIEGLLAAYDKLPAKIHAQYGLVLAGGKGWQDEEILVAIAKLKKKGRNIIQTGYLPDADTAPVISGASVLVFPSHYEGFGIPPLEAMACGVPVIASNNTSLPEVVGNAGLLIGAEDTKAWTEGMAKLLTDHNLQQKLITAGYDQAKKFTWDKSADQLKDALEKI
jgi:glycosyltransferase involved in cell wall biosynthesis